MRVKTTVRCLFFRALLIMVVCLGVVLPHSARAAENGMGVYALGYNSSMAGFLPPPGAYLRNRQDTPVRAY